MYSIQALWTAALRKLPADGGGAQQFRLRRDALVQPGDAGAHVPGLDLPGIDFVRIAEGMGCDAVRISRSSDLAPALKRGLAHDGVSLIEVMVDSAVPMLYTQKH